MIEGNLNQDSEQNYNLSGPYQLKLNFTNATTTTPQNADTSILQNVFQEISGFATEFDEHPEDEEEDQLEGEFDLGRMITAEDIDEEGNLIEE